MIEIWFSMDSINSTNDWTPFAFVFSCFFVILPVIASMFQLHRETKRWMMDDDSRHIVQPWIMKHFHYLYIIAMISGSGFAAVELCNSQLFQLSLFCMNLPQRQTQIFKNKRLFSIVLLENVPQICLQIVYLLFLKVDNSTDSIIIALIAMFFSVSSVVLSLFTYNTKEYVFKTENLVVIKFKIDSNSIRNMKTKTFQQQICNQRKNFNHQLSKILSVNYYHVEQLKPIPCSEGVLMTFIVRTDIAAKMTMDKIQNAIQTGRFQQVCIYVCYVFHIQLIELSVKCFEY